MKKEEFLKRFNLSVDRAVNFARESVKNKIPGNTSFNLYCYNSSVYPDSKGLTNKNLRVSKDEAISVLFQKESVPRWINIFVSHVDGDTAILSLKYSDRFCEDNNDLDFYDIEDTSPFKIGGPYRRSESKDGEKYSMEEFNEDTGELK